MDSLTEETKTILHHILHKHKFYQMELNSYSIFLSMLNQEPTLDCIAIQQRTFRGIVNIVQTYRNNIFTFINEQRFDRISEQIKSQMYKILHQFVFLNNIKVQDMLHTNKSRQPGKSSKRTSFDDQMEKQKLNSMYFGPFSIYSLGNVLPQSLPLVIPKYNDPYSHRAPMPIQNMSRLPVTIRTFDEVNQKIPIPVMTMSSGNQRSGYVQSVQNVSVVNTQSEQKRKKTENWMKNVPLKVKQNIELKFSSSLILQQKSEEFKFCNCRGYLNDKLINNCVIKICNFCKTNLHQVCINESQYCVACKINNVDPFIDVVEALQTQYIDDLEKEIVFSKQLNLKKYQTFILNGYEIMVSCCIPSNSEVCWPDSSVLLINNQIIFQIPPLLVNHQELKRKDKSYFITKYIFRQKNYHFLDKMSFSLNIKPIKSQKYRNNHQNSFLIGFYLVKKMQIEEVYKRTLQFSQNIDTIEPFDWFPEDKIQIKSITVCTLDPYSGHLIQEPVRGIFCVHLQSFDLKTFLIFTYQSKVRQWLCPYCKKDARILLVDKYQLRVHQYILKMQKIPNKIIFIRDGTIKFEGIVQLYQTQQMINQ